MKTTTHKIAYALSEGDLSSHEDIDKWLLEKYRSQQQLIQLKTVRTGAHTELQIEYSFGTFDEANRFYRRVIMKMISDLQQNFSARISGQSSCPDDYADR